MELTTFAIENMTVKKDLMKNPLYQLAFSVEEVNSRVLAGVPFREAYKQVGQEIEKGNFEVPAAIHHTHEGSLGNLCNQEIDHKMQRIMEQFAFDKMQTAIQNLLT
ncbi:argininosuccinate lyase [Geofilum rubicundum JCM 15548]|uniref:Argininosuccinate lyase n=1 Tax=Geofilum rubicundum JCM 15548 TaxID=1236989 RepID=A0A0E9LVE4_9BACT|nr:argininosuccinate lyase [Geofilum rubicundum JCM 15548]